MKKEDHDAVPDSVLTKEFLSQFKTEDDVSQFLNKLHSQVLEKMLWWSRPSTRSGRSRWHLPVGMGVCPSECHCNGGCPLRPAASSSSAWYVWKEPYIQNRWRGWLRLRGSTKPHRRRQDRHHPTHHPPLPLEWDWRSLSRVWEQVG